MTLFQWLTLPLLLLLTVGELVGLLRREPGKWFRLLRLTVWLAAAVAILRPDWVQLLANQLYIGRGADLVFYTFMLIFPVVTFYFYARCVSLQRQITQLTRHLAIREAEMGGKQGP